MSETEGEKEGVWERGRKSASVYDRVRVYVCI